MELKKIFKPKKKLASDPSGMMRAFEKAAKKTDKRSSYIGDASKKKK